MKFIVNDFSESGGLQPTVTDAQPLFPMCIIFVSQLIAGIAIFAIAVFACHRFFNINTS